MSRQKPCGIKCEKLRRKLDMEKRKTAKFERDKHNIQNDVEFRNKQLERCDFGTLACKKCTNPQQSYKRGHHKTCCNDNGCGIANNKFKII